MPRPATRFRHARRLAWLAGVCVLLTGPALAKAQLQFPPGEQKAARIGAQNGGLPLPEQSALTDETAAALKQVIAVLKQSAQDPNPKVSSAAIVGLAQFVAYDETIMDVLWTATDSSEAAIKQAGVQAILLVPDVNDKSIDALLRLLGDDELEPGTRDKVFARLISIGAAQVVPRAILILETGTPAAQQRVMTLLTDFSENARAALPALLTVATSAELEPGLRAQAISAASHIANRAAQAETRDRAIEAIARASIRDTFNRGGFEDKVLASNPLRLVISGRALGTVSISRYDADKDGFVTEEELLPFFRAQAQALHDRPPPTTNAPPPNADYPATSR